MTFRQGDSILIQIGQATVRLNAGDSMALEAILLDKEYKEAFAYLEKIIYPCLKNTIKSRETKNLHMPSEVQEAERIIKEKDYEGALRYIKEVVYKKVAAYTTRPSCKPFFETPK